MSDLIFFSLVTLYAWVAMKVREWVIISLLGFKWETPQGFMDQPWMYGLVRMALFLVAVGTAFTINSLPWYVGVCILAVANFVASLVGRKRAYATFRRLHLYLAQGETDPQERASLEADARVTDKELTARLTSLKGLEKVLLRL